VVKETLDFIYGPTMTMLLSWLRNANEIVLFAILLSDFYELANAILSACRLTLSKQMLSAISYAKQLFWHSQKRCSFMFMQQ